MAEKPCPPGGPQHDGRGGGQGHARRRQEGQQLPQAAGTSWDPKPQPPAIGSVAEERRVKVRVALAVRPRVRRQ